jgi:TonB-linked SusC/RagA family outer membrane protein
MKKLTNMWWNTFFPHKISRKMKLTAYLIFISLFQIQANSNVENDKVTLNLKNVTYLEVFRAIESQTEFNVLYNNNELNNAREVSVNVKNRLVFEVLKDLFKNTSIEYRTVGKQIVLIHKKIDNSVKQNFFNKSVPLKTTIKGVVMDQYGNAIPGVSVLEKGTLNGTVTDFDGIYAISVTEENTVLAFSYLGYITKEVLVKNQTEINITLEEEVGQLDEIVVVGYGTRKKSHSTGSISKIGGEEVAAVQTTRVDQALQGKLSGVRVQNLSSEPGAAPKVQIRASASVTSGGDALIIVDGYPITGDLSTVNPNDIESLEVLKDAASAAIYGSRGANGVILITTKKGKSGDPSFSYNTYVSVANVYKTESIYPTHGEWAKYIEDNRDDWATESDLGISGFDFLFNTRLQAIKDISDAGFETNWQDQIFKSGVTKNHDFSIRGGTEKTKYFASVGYLDADGVLQKSDYERYNMRINLDSQLTPRLKAGISANGSYAEKTSFPIELHNSLRNSSSIPVFHTEETLEFIKKYDKIITDAGYDSADAGADSGGAITSIYNLVPGDYGHEWHYNLRGNGEVHYGLGLSNNNSTQSKIDSRNILTTAYFGNVNGYLDYELVEGLNLKVTLGGDYEQKKEDEYQLSFGDKDGISDTNYDIDEIRTTSVLNENVLSYSKVFNDKHDLNVILGASFARQTYRRMSVDGDDFVSDDLLDFSSFGTVVFEEYHSARTNQSYFMRTNYAFDDKYLLSFSLRTDGDSRFGANQRWGTFPAVSLGWNVHKEEFFEPISDVLSNLKLRLSYGSLGTTAHLGYYDALSILSAEQITLGGNTEVGLSPSNIANPDLTWQTSTEINYGLNLGFLNNRLRLGVDYYTSTAEDMLLKNPLPTSVYYFNSADVNLGKLESKGLELELGGTIISNENFRWNANTTFSTVDTKVIDLGGVNELADPTTDGRHPTFVTAIGGGVSEMWGYVFDKEIDPFYLLDPSFPINGSAGQVYVKDISGNGSIGEEDKVFLGSNVPDFIWGISNNFSYKKWDLAMSFDGSHGAKVQNADPYYYETQWRGDTNSLFTDQAFVKNKQDTDYYMQDASYVALRNLTLGYTLKDLASFERIGISSLRFYAASTNLLYFMADNYTSFNPEGVTLEVSPTSFGTQRGAMPITRSFTLGLNFNF